jgi:hypothetical protein
MEDGMEDTGIIESTESHDEGDALSQAISSGESKDTVQSATETAEDSYDLSDNLLVSLDDEDEAEEDQDEDDAEVEEEAPKRNSKAEKRIQKLVAERRAAEEAAQRHQEQLAMFQQQVQQFQMEQYQRQAQYEQERAVLAKELEIMRSQQERVREEDLSPYDRLKMEASREIQERLNSEWGEKFSVLQSQHQQAMQQFQARQEEEARQKRIQGYHEDTQEATKELLSRIKNPKVASTLQGPLSTLVLNHAAATGMMPKEAAKEFDRFMRTYVLALQKSKAKPRAEVAQKSAKVPKLVSSKGPSKGQRVLSNKAAQDKGYEDALEAMIAGDQS